jgi:hypothetical protein
MGQKGLRAAMWQDALGPTRENRVRRPMRMGPWLLAALSENGLVVVRESGSESPRAEPSVAKKPRRVAPARVILPRGDTPRLSTAQLPEGASAWFRVLSWNVAGLRGLLKKGDGILRRLVEEERPHVLCLQETKLQESHTVEQEEALKLLLPDYSVVAWACSTAKKGYSGTCILISRHSPLSVQGILSGIGQEEGDAEGRVLVADLGLVFLVTCYTPNAGDGLKRLSFRTEIWDARFREFLKELQVRKPVVVAGDLNTAHGDLVSALVHQPVL